MHVHPNTTVIRLQLANRMCLNDGARRRDSKSERLRKQKAVTPHHPAKQPRLFQADQQETELRQSRTFRKWGHNLAVYYAANLHGSCVNSAKSA